MTARVVAVSSAPKHGFSKVVRLSIRLIEGLGVEGDAHAGATVKHRSRVARDPTTPNLRQVHLLHAELFEEPDLIGFGLKAGDIGENVLTEGLDLLGLPRGTRLGLGGSAVVEVTGLRNPCHQLDDYKAGLTRATLARDGDGRLVRKAGVMAIVLAGGEVTAGDPIRVMLPAVPHMRLEPV
jgi:MOSC domain-containing protein YiiM